MESAKQAMDLLLENTDPSPRITLFKRFYRLDLFMTFCRTPLVAKKNEWQWFPTSSYFQLRMAGAEVYRTKIGFLLSWANAGRVSWIIKWTHGCHGMFEKGLNWWVPAGGKTPGFGLADTRRKPKQIWSYGCKICPEMKRLAEANRKSRFHQYRTEK